jgi:EF-P beta-lysylation protein EpmB
MSWREIQKQNFTSWPKLAAFLQIEGLQGYAHPHFPLNLPRRLAEKIEKGNPHDPVLRQFLPSLEEAHKTPGFSLDPVGDQGARKSQKLLKKYEGRALLVTTSACAMHCRFCFRQNFDYVSKDFTFDQELKLIGEDPSITEIILSGGDPLSLSNTVLQNLIQHIVAIPHVKRLRFHTRFPIGIPERIDAPLLEILQATRLQPIFVIHCNHPKELDADIFQALRRLQALRIPVLNSAVLLRGVNDTPAILHELFELLSDHGILAYYLNQLDRVQGAAHFEVPQQEGLKLLSELMTSLPGYAVPRYVQEVAGEPYKTPLYL